MSKINKPHYMWVHLNTSGYTWIQVDTPEYKWIHLDPCDDTVPVTLWPSLWPTFLALLGDRSLQLVHLVLHALHHPAALLGLDVVRDADDDNDEDEEAGCDDDADDEGQREVCLATLVLQLTYDGAEVTANEHLQPQAQSHNTCRWNSPFQLLICGSSLYSFNQCQ